MNPIEKQHEEQIIDQFSKQAVPFAELPGHLDSMDLLMTISGAGAEDTVLDVACGPGLVACAFAPQVRHIEGIDITKTMIEQARQKQKDAGLNNATWRIGTVDPLPYNDESFSLVITRYSFHHFLHPQRVLKEMVRVCQPGGRILVADVVLRPEKAAAYDRMEKMRDPSHARALISGELARWFDSAGLTECRQSEYAVDVALEAQLHASFPDSGDDARLREMISGDIGKNALGINARRQNNAVFFSYPISVFVGRKPC